MILEGFNKLKQSPKIQGLGSDLVLARHKELFDSCQKFLSSAKKIGIVSKITGKRYFSFLKGKRISRAINEDLYFEDSEIISRFWSALEKKSLSEEISREITRAVYSISIAFCATIDLIKDGDQKTTGTFFEYWIGHLVSRHLGISPEKRVVINNIELPTDFVFRPGEGKANIHLPIKASTRERVIQVWAHQRLLDGFAGYNAYKGVLVCLSETKTEKKSREVIEICLPDQWRMYQNYIAQMTRVYYLDLPEPYLKLSSGQPRISVRPFGDFYQEVGTLISHSA